MARAKVGEKAPHFDMASTKEIKTLKANVKLEDYSGRWVALFFWRR